MASEGFGSQLSHAIAATSPLCVGLDPSPALLNAWGLNDDAQALEALRLPSSHRWRTSNDMVLVASPLLNHFCASRARPVCS